jgi:hypothetical protein
MRVALRAPVAATLAVMLAVAAAAPIETTVVDGRIPDALVGRWLVVERNRLKTGVLQPFALLWEIRRGADGPELTLLRRRLPEVVRRQLVAAGSAGRAWTPSEEDLRRIAERWDALPESAADVERVEHRVVAGPSGTELEIVTEERFSGTRPLTATRATCTVRESAAERLVGRFKRVAEIAAPGPVSLALDGELHAYRLPTVPPRSRVRRLLDACLGRDEPS